MRHFCAIGTLLMTAVLAACNPSVVEPEGRPCRELSAIDSLLWTQPDSALTRLLLCYDTVSDRHYANLLLAELLYKNDYAQTNRAELLEAVAHYDSLPCPFLAARSHYINGVGYYERDSVVPACEEYLKAVEIMEGSFPEKDLVGKKAKFMALTYTHICGLFSDQYLHQQAIYFGKRSLFYYNHHDAEPWHVAWMFDEIGSQYNMMQQWDSAEWYYDRAIAVLPDTNNLTYRDVSTVRAFLNYTVEKEPQHAIKRLRCLLAQAESEKEYWIRSLIIGEVFFHERQFDSAFLWLKNYHIHAIDLDSKVASAFLLKEICDTLGMTDEAAEFNRFLAESTFTTDHQSDLHSILMELYQSHRYKQWEIQHRRDTKEKNMKQYWYMGLLAVTVITVGFLIHWNHRKKIRAQEEKLSVQQKKNRETIKKLSVQLEEKEKEKEQLLAEYERQESELKKKKDKTLNSTNTYKDFRKEAACQSIVSSIRSVRIKTDQKVTEYKNLALNPASYKNYLAAINRHGIDFLKRLKARYPHLTKAETKICCLVLLDLENKEMAVLLQISYQALGKQMNSLLEKTGMCREELFTYIVNIAFSNEV